MLIMYLTEEGGRWRPYDLSAVGITYCLEPPFLEALASIRGWHAIYNPDVNCRYDVVSRKWTYTPELDPILMERFARAYEHELQLKNSMFNWRWNPDHLWSFGNPK